jgi:hypothetical protein
MGQEHAHQAGRNRNDARLSRRAVLKTAVVMDLPRSRPTLAHGRAALLKDQRAPSRVRQRAVRTAQGHSFRQPQPTEVDASEERDETTPSYPAVPAHIRDSRERLPGLLRVHHDPTVHLLGHLPLHERDRVLGELPEFHRVGQGAKGSLRSPSLPASQAASSRIEDRRCRAQCGGAGRSPPRPQGGEDQAGAGVRRHSQSQNSASGGGSAGTGRRGHRSRPRVRSGVRWVLLSLPPSPQAPAPRWGGRWGG